MQIQNLPLDIKYNIILFLSVHDYYTIEPEIPVSKPYLLEDYVGFDLSKLSGVTYTNRDKSLSGSQVVDLVTKTSWDLFIKVDIYIILWIEQIDAANKNFDRKLNFILSTSECSPETISTVAMLLHNAQLSRNVYFEHCSTDPQNVEFVKWNHNYDGILMWTEDVNCVKNITVLIGTNNVYVADRNILEKSVRDDTGFYNFFPNKIFATLLSFNSIHCITTFYDVYWDVKPAPKIKFYTKLLPVTNTNYRTGFSSPILQLEKVRAPFRKYFLSPSLKFRLTSENLFFTAPVKSVKKARFMVGDSINHNTKWFSGEEMWNRPEAPFGNVYFIPITKDPVLFDLARKTTLGSQFDGIVFEYIECPTHVEIIFNEGVENIGDVHIYSMPNNIINYDCGTAMLLFGDCLQLSTW